MNYMQLIETFVLPIIVAYLITPFIARLAVKLNYLDNPKSNKVHAHPTPLLGGAAIFIAFMVTMIIKCDAIGTPQIKALLLGTSLLFIIGLIDDKMGIMPGLKLLGQFLAAMIVIKAGLRIGFIKNYYLSTIITYIWVIGVTNAFNLLDNMNGLSAGLAGIASLFFGIIAYLNGQYLICVISLALAGSTLGFLKHNFPKAKIFMGDSGSFILGYVLSAVAVMGSWRNDAITPSLLIPIFVLGYPIFDTTLVSVMRTLQGRSIFQGGKDHSSHMLSLIGFKRYRAVLMVYLISICLGIAAITIRNISGRSAIILGVATFIVMLILGIRLGIVHTRRFGHKDDIKDKNAQSK